MPKTRVNDVELHYQQMGDGEDVVMIHGLFASLAFWYLSVMPAFAGRHRVTAYDLRGHGYSEVSASRYTSADMAEDLDGLLDQLGIARAHVIGHSFGGAVALQYALLRPERALSLTLADVWIPSLQAEPLTWNSEPWRERAVKAAGLGDRPDDLPKVANDAYDEWLRLQNETAAGGFDAWVESALMTQWNRDSRVARRWFRTRAEHLGTGGYARGGGVDSRQDRNGRLSYARDVRRILRMPRNPSWSPGTPSRLPDRDGPWRRPSSPARRGRTSFFTMRPSSSGAWRHESDDYASRAGWVRLPDGALQPE